MIWTDTNVAVLQSLKDGPLTIREIADVALNGLAHTSVRKALTELNWNENMRTRQGESMVLVSKVGRSGKAYLWGLTPLGREWLRLEVWK